MNSPAKWSRTVLECSKIILELCSRTVLDMFKNVYGTDVER